MAPAHTQMGGGRAKLALNSTQSAKHHSQLWSIIRICILLAHHQL